MYIYIYINVYIYIAPRQHKKTSKKERGGNEIKNQ